jgi:uncharacterized membrane protein
MMIPEQKQKLYPIVLILGAIIGWTAAFALTLEKLNKLANPDAIASCDISLLVQCGANLNSWQGSLFGFPNPLIGLTAWGFVLTVGVALLGGVQFPKWFLKIFNLGTLAALFFVIWLMYVSMFMLGTLCPWCMVTWAATIPVFIYSTIWSLREGVWGDLLMPLGERLSIWLPSLIIFGYALPAIVAQFRLDWITNIFL